MGNSLIRLHYIWFKDYFTFHDQGINLSSKYNFSYDPDKEIIKVLDTKNDNYIVNFFGDDIDVTAIVGQNGVGKTSLLSFIQHLRSGDLIITECVIVCEKDSKFWAGRYGVDGKNPKVLTIEGIDKDKCLFIQPEEQRFPFGNDIRFIYMTEMFNMSQYEEPVSGGDDLSFASVLYKQTTEGYEEKHITNPVTRYIHRITDWQLNFISNGEEFVKQFNINYPPEIRISPSYDRNAFIKLYTTINNNEYDKEAKKLSDRLSGISKNVKDEYAKAIVMNIISSFEYDIDVSDEKRKALFKKLERFYSSGSGTWVSTVNFLEEINKDNEEYEKLLNENNGMITKDKSRFYINAKPYIEFMKYLEKFFEGKNLNHHIAFDIKISTSDMTIICDFVKEYRKCVHIVDFLSFSWGLSAGENLLLNQFGKLLHLFKKDKKEYYLPQDVNSEEHAQNAVIMLDEAEVAFHPEWQRRYFNAFLNFIQKNICEHGTHVQLIIATHSPIILSDIPKQNTVFLKYDNKTKLTICVEGEETFAANIFSLYNNAFFLDESEIGAFAEDKLCQLVKDIHKLYEVNGIPSEELDNKVLKQISIIGDPYIRRKFEKEYQYCKDTYYSDHSYVKVLDEEIAAKKQELETLMLERSKLGE